MKLGEKIKLLRTEKSLTQPELADKAGIEQSYLSKLENDKAVPSFDIINRISMALGLSGMGLIDSLSQSYVEDHLAHIPEVAAEYALIKQKRETTMKKRFIAASMAVVIGIGVFLVGFEDLLFPETGFYYDSYGVVKAGEPIDQFSDNYIIRIGERGDDARDRMSANKARYDRDEVIRFDRLDRFVVDVEGGRRLYEIRRKEFYNKGESNDEPAVFNKIENNIISILGLMLISAGLFAFLFNIRFKPHK
ncbi:MAG: helix-turn-helix domain-containing protein [Xanthomonadales bacterium]|nr:helix-turn-helix domain-containing protein [Xanthomonadales bacterium]